MIDSAVKNSPPTSPTRSPPPPGNMLDGFIMGKWIKTHPAGAFLRDCSTLASSAGRRGGEKKHAAAADIHGLFRGVSVPTRAQLDRKRPQDSDSYFWTLEEGFFGGRAAGKRGAEAGRGTGAQGRTGRGLLRSCTAPLRMLRRAARSRSCHQLGFFLSSKFPLSHSAKHRPMCTAAFFFLEEVVCRTNKRNKN